MKAEAARDLIKTFPYWHHSFEVMDGVRTPGNYQPEWMWRDVLRLAPDKIKGKRSLDIGACDGYYSLELAKAGAEVLAVDYKEKKNTGIPIVEQISGYKIPFVRSNLYDLSADNIGTFDIVLCLGVIYHVPDLFRALHVVRALCAPGATVFFETDYLLNEPDDKSIAEYFRGDSRFGDFTCCWIPSKKCLFDMLHDTNYEVVRHVTNGRRLIVEARPGNISESIHKTNLAYGDWPTPES